MTTLIRFDPFRELAALQSEMGRLMGHALGDGNGREARSWVPALDAWETEGELVYAFDLPGVPEDKISVEFDDGTLIVSAERERQEKLAEGSLYRFERRFGSFQRSIALPQGVREEDISAKYADGVLELHVRKPEETKPRRIPVGGSEPRTIEGTASKS
ncbi:MAG: Hsp20/alpha crystallin family protein [Gaiellaceae bacterium]